MATFKRMTRDVFSVDLCGAGALGLLLVPSSEGLRVSGFQQGSATAASAQEQGVRRGHVLLACNGHVLRAGASVADLIAARGNERHPGVRVILRLRASGQPMPTRRTLSGALCGAVVALVLSAALRWLYVTHEPRYRACIASSTCTRNVAASLWADYGPAAMLGSSAARAVPAPAALLQALAQPVGWERFLACAWERDVRLHRGGSVVANAAVTELPALLQLRRGDVLAAIERAVGTGHSNEGGTLRARTEARPLFHSVQRPLLMAMP